jgi:outer membrane protein OmpA-like peptidoglycan-associated protein
MGDFDEQLRQRLATFQLHHGLSGDGVAGTLTWQRLMAAPLTLSGTPGDAGGPGPRSASTAQSLTGFETNSAALTVEHVTVIEEIAADLNAHPLVFGGFVTLTGFADRRGEEAANRDLGQQRADAVRERLQSLVTDEETRTQIRAYSLGEPTEGPVADDPDLRRVDVTITRREYHVDLGTNHPTPEVGGAPHVTLPEGPRVPVPIPGPEDEFHLPDWFWQELPPRPPDPPLITQLSTWLNRSLHTSDLANVGADIAAAFGMDRDRVRHMLRDAFQHGGEAAIRALINEAIQRTAGSPSRRPSSPTGPDVEPIPFPTPQVRGEIRF